MGAAGPASRPRAAPEAAPAPCSCVGLALQPPPPRLQGAPRDIRQRVRCSEEAQQAQGTEAQVGPWTQGMEVVRRMVQTHGTDQRGGSQREYCRCPFLPSLRRSGLWAPLTVRGRKAQSMEVRGIVRTEGWQ